MHSTNRRNFLKSISIAGFFFPFTSHANALEISSIEAKETPSQNFLQTEDYLSQIKIELTKEWPHNRTINLVFHGHSVPSGYFKTPHVNTLSAYPHLLLAKLKAHYPNAVVNSIVTSVGGENSLQGAKRFETVFNHNPDVIFIDYALNDRGIGLKASKKSWTQMINSALDKNTKLILLTPSPDLKENILSADAELKKHSDQIKELAQKYKVGLTDSYQAFQEIALGEQDLSNYMAQFNHPNQQGHQVIADKLFRHFFS